MVLSLARVSLRFALSSFTDPAPIERNRLVFLLRSPTLARLEARLFQRVENVHTAWQGRVFSCALTCSLALLAGSCSNDTPTAKKAGPPAQLTIVSGDAQSGTVGQELPSALVVQV